MYKFSVVCVMCANIMRPKKTGVKAIELMERPSETLTDLEHYKVWACDLYVCSNCLREALTGFAEKPLSQRGEKGFDREVEQAKTGVYGQDYFYFW